MIFIYLHYFKFPILLIFFSLYEIINTQSTVGLIAFPFLVFSLLRFKTMSSFAYILCHHILYNLFVLIILM